MVKAYQYTSITSIMLLDCWSIPMVMILTWIFLSTKYRYRKIAGVLVCVAGLVVVVFSDVHSGDRSGKTSISFVNIRVTKKVTAKLSPSVKTLQILIWIICTKSCLIELFFFPCICRGEQSEERGYTGHCWSNTIRS